MFVRRKSNKSGSLSIYVVDKSRGRYSVVKSFGTVHTEAEADLLENKAREWVREQEGDPETLFDRMDEAQIAATIGLTPFIMKRDYTRYARKYPLKSCMKAVATLKEFDYRGKSNARGEATDADMLSELVSRLLAC